jgi:hypothetical protein
MTDQEENDSVLLPPPEIIGGLYKPPKKNPVFEHVFKAPDPVSTTTTTTIIVEKRGSLLGLDRLAEIKRLERLRKESEAAKEPTSQRSKIHSFREDGDSEDVNTSKRLTHPEVDRQKYVKNYFF